MSQEIVAYDVFLASPSGLEREREVFRRTLREYSETEGAPRSVAFRPVGWEGVPGGVGRPQSLINDTLRNCDYFVLVLWDRWGSPPDRPEVAPVLVWIL